jgi:hypothetical protein
MVCAFGVVPPVWKLNVRLAGLALIVAGGAAGFTVIVCCSLPVPPLKLSIAAA